MTFDERSWAEGFVSALLRDFAAEVEERFFAQPSEPEPFSGYDYREAYAYWLHPEYLYEFTTATRGTGGGGIFGAVRALDGRLEYDGNWPGQHQDRLFYECPPPSENDPESRSRSEEA